MKLKITITGPKVHDVGYRPYLTELAMRLALRGFEVYNDEENEQQAVIALAEGDEQRVMRFYNSAMKSRPQQALVDNIKSEDYTGNVMPLWQSAAINSAAQLNKAVPILLEMGSNLKAVKENTDLIPQIAENTMPIPQIVDEACLESYGMAWQKGKSPRASSPKTRMETLNFAIGRFPRIHLSLQDMLVLTHEALGPDPHPHPDNGTGVLFRHAGHYNRCPGPEQPEDQ